MKSIYWVSGVNPEPWSVGTAWHGRSKSGIAPDPQLVAYQKALAEDIVQQNGHIRPHDGDLKVTFYFWRSTAFGHPADATNLQKATEDALQDILYGNDRGNRWVSSCIMEQTPTTDSHIMIQIEKFKLPKIEIPDGVAIPRWADSEWTPPDEEIF